MFENNNLKIVSLSTGTIIRTFLVFIAFFFIWFLQDLALVLLTSIVLASFVEAFVPTFKKIGIGRVFGVVLLYFFIGVIFAILFYLFAPLLITELYNFSNFLNQYAPEANFLNFFQNEIFSGAKDVLGNLDGKLSLSNLFFISKSFVDNLSGGFLQVFSSIFGGVFNFILIIIISFYLSIEEKGIEKFLRIIFPIKYEDYVVDLWNRSRVKIASWVKGQMFLGFLIAILVYLLLLLIGIEYALLLALIAGIMSFLPYGFIIALIPAISFSYLSGGWEDALLVFSVYIIINQFETFLFTPLIINRVVGLSPLMVILSVLIGFELAGFWGMILAVPVSVFFMELMNDIEKNKYLIRNNSKKNEQ